ncbi:hypothetical protein B0H13DRAFT_2373786 [Mycena leptocephala]|nr:hypothetical protein B0H13DRAFT_2373786 [Mycena leptocephala]
MEPEPEPTTPHRSRGVADFFPHGTRPAAQLFSPSVPLQESPGMSSLSGSESSPQPSPQVYGENDLVSHGHLFDGLLPGDVGYVFPDPNATSISAPRIATLTDDDFDDYNSMSYEEIEDDPAAEQEDQAAEQVGGGPYALRANIIPTSHANRVGLNAQERRQVSQAESQSADDAAPGPIPASASSSHSGDAGEPAPQARPARRARKVANGSTKSPLSQTPPTLQFQLPPTLHHPPPAFPPRPPGTFLVPSVPQQPAPQEQLAPEMHAAANATRRSATPSAQQQQVAPQRHAAATATRRSATPSVPQQPVLQNPAARSSTRRSETPSAPQPPSLQNPAVGRQARSATPFGPQHLAPQPMRASSLDYAPIPPEQFTGTLPEFLNQAGFETASFPPHRRPG